MSTYGYSNRAQRGTGGSYNSNDRNRSGGGSFHRNVNTLTRLSGSSKGVGGNHQGGVGGVNSGPAIPPRNVPRPIQTCSLKKEHGGQDVTAVLVNRNNGSGKRIGWGSALPPSNSTTNTPAAAPSAAPAEVERTETPANTTKPRNRTKVGGQELQYPPLPPTDESDTKNVPWAMHPPGNNNDASSVSTTKAGNDDKKRGMSSSPPLQQQHPLHQQEKGERSYPHERYSRDYHHQPPPHHHREYVPHSQDRRYRSHPDVPYNNHDGYGREDRYYSNDRNYRRNDHPRPYSRDRGDYREYNRPRYDPRDRPPPPEYMHREHRPRHSSNIPTEKEAAAPLPTSDVRNHVPNSYYQSEERRWGDDEDDESISNKKNDPSSVPEENQHSNHEQSHVGENHDSYMNHNDHGNHHDHRYGAGYRDIPRRHSQEHDREKMERDHGYRNRNYDMPPRTYQSYSSRRNSYDQQRLNYEQANPDERRPQDPHQVHMQPNTYHRQHHPPQNEEEVVMQAVRERDAAEDRAKQKDMEQQRYRYDKKMQQTTTESCNNAVVPSGPIVILRNKQTSGEASSDVVTTSEQSRKEHTTVQSSDKDVKAIEEKENNDSPKVDTLNSLYDESGASKISLTSLSNDMQQESPKVSFDKVKEGNAVKDTSNEKHESKNAEKSGVDATSKVDSKLSEVTYKDNTYSQTEQQENLLKLNEKNKYKKIESNISNASEPHEMTDSKSPPVPIKAQDRKSFEQQNVLRRVAAHRESSKKKLKNTTFKKKSVKPQQENDTEPSNNTESPESLPPSVEDDEAEPSRTKEQDETKTDSLVKRTIFEEKGAPILGLKKWGPRTKGVLFRRQPDGTVVNADLSEEEIARREERRKAKIARELAREEKRKERLQAIKAREERKQQLKEAKRKDKEESTAKRKFHPDNRKQHREKSPDSGTKSQGAIPKDVKLKSQSFVPAPPPVVSAWATGPPRSVLDLSIPVPTEVPLKSSNDMVIEDITSDSEAAGSCTSNTELESKNVPLKSEEDVPLDNAVLDKFPTPPNQSRKENMDEKQRKFSPSMNPIGLPLTANVATWNAFGASNLFAPPQENGPAHAGTSWGLTNDSSPTLAANEEDDAAALTDASAAVPRDLLSSGPASEEEEVRKVDTKDKSNKERFNKRRPERYHKSRPGRHARPRKSNKPYRQTNEESVPATEAPATSDSKQEVVDKDRIRPKNFKRRNYHKDNRSRPNQTTSERSSKPDDTDSRPNRVRRPNFKRRNYHKDPKDNRRPNQTTSERSTKPDDTDSRKQHSNNNPNLAAVEAKSKQHNNNPNPATVEG